MCSQYDPDQGRPLIVAAKEEEEEVGHGFRQANGKMSSPSETLLSDLVLAQEDNIHLYNKANYLNLLIRFDSFRKHFNNIQLAMY